MDNREIDGLFIAQAIPYQFKAYRVLKENLGNHLLSKLVI